MNDITMLIKRAALEAVKESSPTAIVFGNVISVEPLKINVEQKLILTSAQLILTNNVRDYDLYMTVNHSTEQASAHSHGYTGKKKFTVNNGLIIGDEVILIQMQGGQKYVVLEKVVKA